MGYQCGSVRGGDVQCPHEGSGFRLIATQPYCSTHFTSSGMQVAGATPGLCGSMAAGTKWSGNRRLTRKHSSLHTAAQVDALDGLAERVVRDLQVGDARRGRGSRDARDLLVAPNLQRPGRRGVVAMDVDDHARAASVTGASPKSSGRPT